ncbi:MAG TPA: LPS export ABC transporter permease LptF [Acidiferrobacteraceae bacterium]|nr:LPS export ABC transporter permease LptF [Acidiferrobacteraceae bacterium]
MFERFLSKWGGRPLIVDRAFYREARQTTVVVTVLFLSLYVVVSLVNLLSQAASGAFPGRVVLLLLALETLKNVNLMLPLTMFVGVLLTLARWYRDNEMTVLAACGVGLRHFVKPALVVAFWTALIVSLITFYIAPLSAIMIDKVQSESGNSYQYGIAAGQFNHSRDGRSIFYVGRRGHGNRLHDIFASSEQFGNNGVLVAKTGYEYTDHTTRAQYLVLENGTRYQGVPGKPDFKILHYRTYGLHVEPPQPASMRVLTIDEVPTPALWRSRRRSYRAELQWRIAKPLALFILAPLAVGLAYGDARRGRFGNLFVAALMYFAYANTLAVAHALVDNGALPQGLGLWWVHLLFAALAGYIIARRTYGRPLIGWPRGS